MSEIDKELKIVSINRKKIRSTGQWIMIFAHISEKIHFSVQIMWSCRTFDS